MKVAFKISNRVWSFIKKKDSFIIQELMSAMALKEDEAFEILQHLHDQGYITMKWVHEKGKLCFVKIKPFDDHIN